MKAGSSIIFNSSIAAYIGYAGTTVYSASKGGVNSLARTAAIELAKAGIRVNVLSPGITVTEMSARALGGEQGVLDAAASLQPLGRAGQPIDMANAALFLASDQSSLITGQILRVDGGFTAQ
jgi:3-oxoacyl-[acyl-carrier protein] reductase